MEKISILGSGFGGIAAAIRMRARGNDVELFERLSRLGGRAQVFEKNGFIHDAGPTVITAPNLFFELFELLGENLEDHLEFKPLDPWYRFYFTKNNTTFDYGPNQEHMLEQIREISVKDVDGYLRMLKESTKIFELGYEKLASRPFHKLTQMLRYGPDIIRLKGYQSVYSFVSRHIKDENLRQAFSIQPLLVGGNPFSTSSIYSLIHALEKKWGIYFCMGGTGKIVLELEKLMIRHGIKIFYNHDAERINTKGSRVSSIEFTNGKSYNFDKLICNADPLQVSTDLLKGKQVSLHNRVIEKFAKHSMGLFVIFFGTKKKYNNIAHHTIWMGPRYKALLEEIFDKHTLAEDFSVYLHRPTCTDSSFAPPNGDSFYALVPVPNLKGKYNWDEIKKEFSMKVLDRKSVV